jgi:hypothetical protein
VGGSRMTAAGDADLLRRLGDNAVDDQLQRTRRERYADVLALMDGMTGPLNRHVPVLPMERTIFRCSQRSLILPSLN